MSTEVLSCSATNCSFNHEGCAAPAITIAGDSAHAHCATFISLDIRGGLPVAHATVGACQRAECNHNSGLLCTATDVKIGSGSDVADCLTYSAS